jgi:hypothetical protein
MDQIDGSPHWSKDFVEHLRTVHFALITVSAGLILLVASSNTYKPVDAMAELDQIQKVKSNWDFNTILSTARTRFTNQIFGFGSAEPMTSEPISFVCDTSDAVGDKFIPEGHPFTCRIVQRWAAVSYGPWVEDYVTEPPDRIIEFKSWWEKHRAPRNFVYLIDLFLDGTKRNIAQQTRQLVVAQKPADDSVLPKDVIDFYLRPEPMQPSESPPPPISGANSVYGASLHGFDRTFGEFIFPAAVQPVKLDEHSFLQVPAGCGEFEDCFPSLAKATQNLEAASLGEMQTYLAQQLEKGGDVFEAFGLKVPVEKLTIWGVVIVLAVQLYLCLHLIELHSTIKSSDQGGCDVPWIGMYTSTASRIVFFVSIFVLPLVAVGLLVFHAVAPVFMDIKLRWPMQWKKPIEVSAYLCSVFASLCLAWFTWRLQPLALRTSAARKANTDESQTPIATAGVEKAKSDESQTPTATAGVEKDRASEVL